MDDTLQRIAAILGPIADQDWHGKWRIKKVIELCQNKHPFINETEAKVLDESALKHNALCQTQNPDIVKIPDDAPVGYLVEVRNGTKLECNKPITIMQRGLVAGYDGDDLTQNSLNCYCECSGIYNYPTPETCPKCHRPILTQQSPKT